VLSGTPISTNVTFEWYQEFFNDHPWVNLSSALPANFRQAFTTPPAYPNVRVFPGSESDYPWAREQNAIAGAAGAISMYNVTRTTANMFVPEVKNADCRYYAMFVHTLWVRIAIRTTTSLGTYPRFRIYAHAGGIGEEAEYAERISIPYGWATPEE
jgi:hypothetical protein